MRSDVDRLGTLLVVLVTIVVFVSICVYGSLKLTVTDLQAQASIVRSEVPPPSRSALGEVLSGVLASDLASNDASGLDARALELDHRSDRLLELTAVVALVGMVVAFFTGRPAMELTNGRDARKPQANTSSNGSV